MIKVKLYTKENYWKDSYKNVEYDDEVFFDLMNGKDQIFNVHPPFRDQESKDLLMKSEGIYYLEDDWYSIIWDERRTSLAALTQGLRYGLALLDYTRKGIYMSYKEADDKIWEILSRMPFDIFITLKVEDIERYQLFGQEEFLITNYPFMGKYVEVLVKNDNYVFDKQYYAIAMKQTWKDNRCELYRDQNGNYYLNKWDLEALMKKQKYGL